MKTILNKKTVLIFLIAIVLILRYMYIEYKKSKSKVIVLTDEQMGDIEDKAKYARKHYRPHWDRFNMLKYVEYLEYKASNG
jgi:hypothetical protein